MSAFTDQLSEHSANVFRNVEHFGEAFTFQSNAADDITVDGVFDNELTKSHAADVRDSEECDATIQCVPVEQYTAMRAAVLDFDKDGWIEVHGDKYSIVGTADRDAVSLTLKLALSKLKTFRSSRRT